MSTRCFNFNDYAYRGKGSSLDDLPAIPRKPKKLADKAEDVSASDRREKHVSKEKERSHTGSPHGTPRLRDFFSTSKKDTHDHELPHKHLVKSPLHGTSSEKKTNGCFSARDGGESNFLNTSPPVNRTKPPRLASIKDVSRTFFPNCRILSQNDTQRKMLNQGSSGGIQRTYDRTAASPLPSLDPDHDMSDRSVRAKCQPLMPLQSSSPRAAVDAFMSKEKAVKVKKNEASPAPVPVEGNALPKSGSKSTVAAVDGAEETSNNSEPEILKVNKKRRLKKRQIVDSDDESYTPNRSCSSSSALPTTTEIIDTDKPDGGELKERSFVSSGNVHREKSPAEVDSDSSCSDEESDSKATAALLECLNISDRMTQSLVRSLGGNNEEHQREIRKNVAAGRCHAYRSFNLPAELADNKSSVVSKLKEYQKTGVQWLITLHEYDRNGILADEMGLGKTAQTCVFLNYLYETARATHPTIIAAPASLLDNWMSELHTWAPYLRNRVMRYHGKQAERRELAVKLLEKMGEPDQYFIIVTSVTTITSKWDEQYLKQMRPIEYLVVDEAHSLKNKDALTYKKLNKTIRCHRRLLLTGSPIQNRTEELRNLLLFVMPLVFDADSLNLALESYADQARRAQRFHSKQNLTKSSSTSEVATGVSAEASTTSPLTSRTNIIDAIETFAISTKKTDLSPDVECLQKILAPFILRRLKSEVLGDLPVKINRVIRCDMEGRQKELYIKEILRQKTELSKQLNTLTCILTGEKEDESSKKEAESCQKAAEESQEPETLQQGGSAAIPFDNAGEAIDVVSSDPVGQGDTAAVSTAPANDGSTATSRKRKRRGLEEVVEEGGESKKEKTGSEVLSKAANRKFVNSLLFRLRRICNHPLMMQDYYTEEEIQRIVEHYYLRVEGFAGNPRKKVEEEIRKWSDYEIHQGCLGDPRLEWARIPPERLLDSAKIRRMLQIVQQVYAEGKKALIFSQFTTYLDVIHEVLATHCPHIYCLRLDGSTVVAERQNLVNEFYNNPSVSLFLLSTKAGGQGLNLTAATTVILMDQDWNPHNDRQAEDRVHRLGQTHDVTIYRLCCRGTIEESILRCCQKKLDLDEAFGGNTELLQAAILKDSLETHEYENGEEKPIVSLDEKPSETEGDADEATCRMTVRGSIDEKPIPAAAGVYEEATTATVLDKEPREPSEDKYGMEAEGCSRASEDNIVVARDKERFADRHCLAYMESSDDIETVCNE